MIIRIFNYIYKRIVWFLVNHVLDGTNPMYFTYKRKLLISIGINVGRNTKIVGPIFCTGKLSIGESCWIGANFTVRGNGSVTIGNNVDIGPDVTFLTGSHEIGGKERRAGQGYNCNQKIGNGCWLGAKSVFVNNICVGDSIVVAAMALVCKDVSDNVLIGGVPAKIIKTLSSDETDK